MIDFTEMLNEAIENEYSKYCNVECHNCPIGSLNCMRFELDSMYWSQLKKAIAQLNFLSEQPGK